MRVSVVFTDLDGSLLEDLLNRVAPADLVVGIPCFTSLEDLWASEIAVFVAVPLSVRSIIGLREGSF